MAAQFVAISASELLGDIEMINHGPMTIQGGALCSYLFDS